MTKKTKQLKVEQKTEVLYEVGQEIEVQGKQVKIVEVLEDSLHVKNIYPNYDSFIIQKDEI